MHTGDVIVIDPQTLTTVLTVLAAFLGVAGYLRAIKQDLAKQIERSESSLTDKIDGVKADVVDVKADVNDVRAAVRVLEQRTFEMVHRGAATDAGQGPA